MVENKRVNWSLDVARRTRADKAIRETREIFEKSDKFKSELEYYLGEKQLKDLLDALSQRSDFKKIEELNGLLNKIYIAHYGSVGLSRIDSGTQKHDRARIIRECFEKINSMMKEEGIKPHDHLWELYKKSINKQDE